MNMPNLNLAEPIQATLTPTLKQLLADFNQSQQSLADHLSLSKAAVNHLINKGIYPVKRPKDEIDLLITQFLAKFTNALTVGWCLPQSTQASTSPLNPKTSNQEEEPMLLRKQNLTPQARKSFGLRANPFTNDIQNANQLFLTDDVIYVRESMYQAAKHGGFIAVCGESGAGKTTLKRDLVDRIDREHLNIITIEPYVLAAEDNDIKGKALKSAHIAEAILYALAPSTNAKRSPEARFRQVHNLLKESSRAGNQHVIMIEEAHCLSVHTLKHLKRFFELEDGYKKLISIILIGQNELAIKLSEGNQEVREVVQRCEIVTLEPLTQFNLTEYLAHRCKAVDVDIKKIIDQGGIDAIAERLNAPSASTSRNRKSHSLLYPLAIGNLITAAINSATEIGIPVVSRDVVMEV